MSLALGKKANPVQISRPQVWEAPPRTAGSRQPAAEAAPGQRAQPPALRWPVDLWRLSSLPLLAFLALPLLAIFLRLPPANLAANLRSPQVLQAVGLSMTTSLCTTLVALGLGMPVAYLLARRRFRMRRVVDSLVDLPTVLPPAVAGVALLMAFGRRGLVGSTLDQFGIQIAFTQVAVIMAQTFVAAPFFIRAAMVGFGAIHPELEQAAALDGADGWQVFRNVTLPLAWPALLTGCIMTWARALGEFGATIIFAGNYPGRTQTMPLAIYLGFEMDLTVALTLAAILIGCSFVVLMLVKMLLHREVDGSLGS